jgi:penicillin V acylase-like amidase (Ntn superfamily)
MKTAGLALALVLVPAGAAAPCTTLGFQGRGAVLVGKNYDWSIGDGLLVVNKRGVAKRSLADVCPARWTSRFGSVTFNQYGREFPSGGINQAGLVVELMWLEETRYPSDPHMPGVGSLEWIQYQLDTAGSVADLVENARWLRIASAARLHYFACDPSGACAAVEFLDGRAVIHTDRDLPLRALTNTAYADARVFAERAGRPDGNRPPPAGEGSLERFARGAALARSFVPRSGRDDVHFVLEAMGAVRQRATTQWTIAYDLVRRELAFTTRNDAAPRWVRLAELDFECATPVQVLDVQQRVEGGPTPAFAPYTPEVNQALVARAYATTPFLRDTPSAAIEAAAGHPASMTCLEPAGPGVATTPKRR